jgi:hypothetical protein
MSMPPQVFTGDLPEIHWLPGDDLCDCAFQRIGQWTNPYIARTLRVRMCCLYKEMAKQFPQFFQEIPAYYDSNRHAWRREPQEWDSDEADMPVYLWYRQMAAISGKPLDEIRRRYEMRKRERPKRISTAEKEAREIASRPSEEEIALARRAQMKETGWLLD